MNAEAFQVFSTLRRGSSCEIDFLFTSDRWTVVTDQEAIEELRARLTINSSAVSSEQTWCLAALAQMYLGAFDKARDCVRSALILNASSQNVKAVQGWIELVSYPVAGLPASRNTASLESASLFFEGVLQKTPRELDV